MMSNEADGRISGNNIVTGNKGVGKEQHPRVNPVCGSVSTLRTKSPSADVKKSLQTNSSSGMYVVYNSFTKVKSSR